MPYADVADRVDDPVLTVADQELSQVVPDSVKLRNRCKYR